MARPVCQINIFCGQRTNNYYLRVKLKVQSELVVESFDEKWSPMKVFASLKQMKNNIISTNIKNNFPFT